MNKLIRNVVVKPYTFSLTFEDGRKQKIEIEAESYRAAAMRLPRFAEVGRYRYKLEKD